MDPEIASQHPHTFLHTRPDPSPFICALLLEESNPFLPLSRMERPTPLDEPLGLTITSLASACLKAFCRPSCMTETNQSRPPIQVVRRIMSGKMDAETGARCKFRDMVPHRHPKPAHAPVKTDATNMQARSCRSSESPLT